MYDVIIIGGSYAGISAAMQLGRARRPTLVIDAGRRRNRFAASSHGFLGADGRDPAAIAAAGKAEVLAYSSVTWIEGTATEARRADGEFVVRAGDTEHAGRRVVLALGVRDEWPNVPGVEERWGKSIFHCPYCHGYELNQGNIACLATMAASEHVAAMLPDWGKTTYFTNGQFEPEHRKHLEERGVAIERSPVVRVSGEPKSGITLHLHDGRALDFAGLFLAPKTRPASDLAEQLGCALEEGPMGPFIKTDAMRATTVPGVFAGGDAALAAGSVAFAVAEGARAGIAAHRSLIFE
jgi:thioredoxin reductase